MVVVVVVSSLTNQVILAKSWISLEIKIFIYVIVNKANLRIL